jgi:hypothetical protein
MLIRPRAVLLYVLLPLALMASCVDPVCGCSPPFLGVEVQGTLRTAADAPVAGYRVRAEVAGTACGATIEERTSQPTAADGHFTLTLTSYGIAPDSACVRFFARDTAAAAIEVALTTHRVLLLRGPFSPLPLTLTLPP